MAYALRERTLDKVFSECTLARTHTHPPHTLFSIFHWKKLGCEEMHDIQYVHGIDTPGHTHTHTANERYISTLLRQIIEHFIEREKKKSTIVCSLSVCVCFRKNQ